MNDTDSNSIDIRLYGPLEVTTSDGVSILPKGRKTQALIALLATSDTLKRSRTWLQDTLWSDRGPEQQSGSLRQALAELRNSFGDIKDILIADRQSIALDTNRVCVLAKPSNSNSEFLEGLNLKDMSFLTWLQKERACRGDITRSLSPEHCTQKSGPRSVVIICESEDDPRALELETAASETLFHLVQDMMAIRVGSIRSMPLQHDSIVVFIKAMRVASTLMAVRFVVEGLPDNQVHWSGSVRIADQEEHFDSNLEFLRQCNRAFEAVFEASLVAPLGASTAAEAGRLANIALRKIFLIRKEEVAQAIDLLNRAYALQPDPLFLAWLAQAYTIQYVENYVQQDAEFIERTEFACRKALEDSPANSNVFAAIANARTNINRNFQAGLVLAKQSVTLNRANPLAWWSLSNALQCLGSTREAHVAAQNAQSLGSSTRLKHWTDFQLSLTASLSGDLNVAAHYGEFASALAPDFKPPLRYLAAVYAIEGNAPRLNETLTRLAECEQGFSIDRMLNDQKYPIGIMRRYGVSLTDGLRSAEIKTS